MISIRTLLLLLFISLGLAGCGTDTSPGNQVSAAETETSNATDSNATSGTAVVVTGPDGSPITAIPGGAKFSLRITDAPIDALARVVMLFTEVELRKTDGGWMRYTLETPVEIDILKYHGTSAADLLDAVPVEAGEYNEIRLVVGGDILDNFVELKTGGIEPLQIPAGSSSGLKIKGDFSINTSMDSKLTVDIDLRRSIRSPGNSGRYQFLLKYRLVNDASIGHVRGIVDHDDLTAASCSDLQVDTFNSVYVFEGHDIVPDDIDSEAGNPEPLTTTSINYDADNDVYFYEAAFLPEGDYTMAVTCNADQEDLDQNDDLQFFDITNITVLVNDIVFL